MHAKSLETAVSDLPNGPRNRPLFPHEVDKVHRVFDQARRYTKLSRHDVKSQRLAAMAIRFYQLGIQDEGELLANVVNAHCKLNGLDVPYEETHSR